MSRLDRVNSLLRQEIAGIIRTKLTRSNIGFVSIVNVSTSKDLAHAKVYYSQIGSDGEKKKTKKILKVSSGFIKGQLGQNLRLKTIPNLTFILDDSLEKGANLLSKLRQIEVEKPS